MLQIYIVIIEKIKFSPFAKALGAALATPVQWDWTRIRDEFGAGDGAIADAEIELRRKHSILDNRAYAKPLKEIRLSITIQSTKQKLAGTRTLSPQVKVWHSQAVTHICSLHMVSSRH